MSRTMHTALFLVIVAHTTVAETVSLDSLADWQVLTGSWQAEGGAIVGRAEAGESAWLITAGDYADFELALEFMTPSPCNGGVQFRSHWLPKLPAAEGVPPQDLPRVMYGYQATIDTRTTDGTGGIADENGRGILVKPALNARDAVKNDDWNRLEIVSRGFVTEVKINGVRACRLYDEKFTSGRVALQIMPPEGASAEVRYRNIRIKDDGRGPGWRSLFDGKTLSGWKVYGDEEFLVDNGEILGRSGPKKSEGYLATETSFTDFHVRGRFKMLGDGNFGLFYRSTITLRPEDGYPVIAGVQGEVEPSFPGSTGWHYESYKRGWIHEPDRTVPAAYAMRPGEWNEIEIRAIGNRTTSWVNGFQVIDFFDSEQLLFEGSFALQLHTGGTDGIRWKDIYVRE